MGGADQSSAQEEPPVTAARVTVVVPVFEVAPFLQECLDSVVGQSAFEDLRVVVIDDGSTDGSRTIADRCAAAHPGRVRVVHQENRGLGASRNRGLDLVDTEYVAFLDSDDVLPIDALHQLLAGLEAHPTADVAVGAMESFPRPTTSWPWLRHVSDGEVREVALEDAPDLVHGPSACNKLFRTAAVRALGVRFAESGHFEDVPFVLPLLLRSRMIVLVPRVVYRYRRGAGGSIMDSQWTRVENYRDHLAVDEALWIALSDLEGDRRRLLHRFVVRSLQGYLLRAPHVLSEPELTAWTERVRDLVRDIDPADVLAATEDLRHRVPFLALVTGDDVLLRDRAAGTRGLVARDGRLFLALDVPEALRPLTALDRVRARLETLTPDVERRRVVLTGQLVLSGADATDAPDVELTLRLGPGRVTVPVQITQRPERALLGEELRWTGFRAVLPIARLPRGAVEPRMVVSTRSGSVSTGLKPSTGFLRAARVYRVGGLIVLPRVADTGTVALDVADGSSIEARLQFGAELVREDLELRRRGSTFGRDRTRRLLHRCSPGGGAWVLGSPAGRPVTEILELFRHLRSTARRRQVHLVVDDPEQLGRHERQHVVRRGSRRHRRLVLAAEVLVGSGDVELSVLPPAWDEDEYLRQLGWRIGALRVLLPDRPIDVHSARALHRAATGVDLLVTAGPGEAETARALGGYGRLAVATGRPRHEPVPPCGEVSPHRVLLRLPEDVRLARRLLEDPALSRELDRHDLHLTVLPASGVGPRVAEDACQRITLAEPGVDPLVLVRSSALVIAPWGATYLDAAALGRPCVLLCPEAVEGPGPAGGPSGGAQGFDILREGFGPWATEPSALASAVAVYAERGFVREDRWSARAERWFAGAGASDRIVEAVEGALRRRS